MFTRWIVSSRKHSTEMHDNHADGLTLRPFSEFALPSFLRYGIGSLHFEGKERCLLGVGDFPFPHDAQEDVGEDIFWISGCCNAE